jgi:HK97 family phage major capsid protein
MPAITSQDLFSVESVRALVIEPVFQASVALSSGLLRVETAATQYQMPTVSGGTAAWYGDLEPISEADVEADELVVTPKKVATLQTVSNEAADDADAASIVGRALVAALADRVDRSFFVGDGPKGPTGLPGITDAEPVDGDPTEGIDAYVDAVAAVESNGGAAGVIWLNPLDWAALSKVKAAADSAVPVLNSQPTLAGNRSLLGLPVRVSKHVVAGTGWVADPSRLAVVMRTDASVVVDRSAAFTKDGAVARAIMRLEFAAPYGGAVAKISVAP